MWDVGCVPVGNTYDRHMFGWRSKQRKKIFWEKKEKKKKKMDDAGFEPEHSASSNLGITLPSDHRSHLKYKVFGGVQMVKLYLFIYNNKISITFKWFNH